ncbi:MAG: transcriptional regulator [Rubrivivax sp.]|nr:MAG: transcriptional regulator [Rubrivivax sp.]
MTASLPPQPLVSGEQLGQLLRSTRKRLKLNQAAIGARLNLSQNRVSYLELHPEELSLKQLLSWCAVLGLEMKLGARGAEPIDTASSEW